MRAYSRAGSVNQLAEVDLILVEGNAEDFTGNPCVAQVFRVADPGESSTRLLSCAVSVAMNMAPCPECC